MSDWLDEVAWGGDGLVPAIAQDGATGKVLMVAWMNREALAETVRTGRAVYWSRSRARLWRKGEESGHVQRVSEVRLDCDGDVDLADLPVFLNCIAGPDVTAPPPGVTPAQFAAADFDGDGDVDLRDFAALHGAFGP